MRLEVTNPGGHSSRPRADNAIYELAEALLRLRTHQFPVSLNEVTRSYFGQAAQFHEPEMAAAMRALSEDRASQADIARLDSSVQLAIAMRTTCVATQLEGGHAENALPQMASAIVNCRILPQQSPDEIIATVRRVLDTDSVRVTTVYEPVASLPSPLTPNVMDPVAKVAAEMYPGIPVITDMQRGCHGRFVPAQRRNPHLRRERPRPRNRRHPRSRPRRARPRRVLLRLCRVLVSTPARALISSIHSSASRAQPQDLFGVSGAASRFVRRLGRSLKISVFPQINPGMLF